MIAAPGVALGYTGDAAKTAECFLDNLIDKHDAPRLYRTGDRGVLRPGGQLEILGRIDTTIKIRGFKTNLLFVEQVFKECEGVGSAAIVSARPLHCHVSRPQTPSDLNVSPWPPQVPVIDAKTEQPSNIAAYLVGDGRLLTEADLRRIEGEVRPRLPEYAFPAFVMALDKLPTKVGESRKMDAKALPSPKRRSGRSAGAHDPSPGRSPGGGGANVERLLIRAFEEVLGVRPAASENFFELGGHSLSAATLVGKVHIRIPDAN